MVQIVYSRVSTAAQSLLRQRHILTEAGLLVRTEGVAEGFRPADGVLLFEDPATTSKIPALLDRLDRDEFVAEQSPRLLRVRHEYSLYAHRISRFRAGQRKVIASTTMIGNELAQVIHVRDGALRAQDNESQTGRLRLVPHQFPVAVQQRPSRDQLFRLPLPPHPNPPST
jgi:hypothetical protein